ncbi:ATP-binding protein [Micromonospora tarapacensis]|uniref:ATP-binding protein n=1 Tax=Micromonospora tarapacensis TaxID=2835305 RepID=UPI002F419BBA
MNPRTRSTVLVGRQSELTRLGEALARTRAGEPATVLVGGEAGVGKTRLLEEFGRSAGDSARVLVGQCLELGEAGLPFAPFAAALRAVLRRDGVGVFDGYEAEFARLLPELARVSPGAATPAAALSDAPRGYLFDLVAQLFGRLAAAQPLVLVIEDLHWADRSTRDLIGFLVRAARTGRLLLVCTYRTDELHRGHPLRPFLAELDRDRGVDRIELARLDRDGTGAVLAGLLGAEPGARAVDDIHDRTQGNPLFIEELAAAGSPIGCAALPDTLRDLLLARVDRLPEPAQRVLRIAAAGGNRLAHPLLAEVAGLPEPELDDALRAAVTAQLLVADPDGDYEFQHALVREAVHDELLPGEHARLHARFAAAVEAQPHLVAAGRAPAEIAHHWYAAHDHPRALVTARVAACAAGDRYAYAEQSRLLERVLELWELVPDAADRLGMDHLAVLEETLAAATIAGDYQRALTLTRAALAEVDSAAQPLRGRGCWAAAAGCWPCSARATARPSFARRTGSCRGCRTARSGCGCSPTSPTTWPASTTTTGPGSPPRWWRRRRLPAPTVRCCRCSSRCCGVGTAHRISGSPSYAGARRWPAPPERHPRWSVRWYTSPICSSNWAATRSRRRPPPTGSPRHAGSASAVPPVRTCSPTGRRRCWRWAAGRRPTRCAPRRPASTRPACRGCTGCNCGRCCGWPRAIPVPTRRSAGR